MPSFEIGGDELNTALVDVLVARKVFTSKREARQMITQGGLYVADAAVTDPAMQVTADMLGEDGVIVRKGKKKYYRLVLKK